MKKLVIVNKDRFEFFITFLIFSSFIITGYIALYLIALSQGYISK